jgi:hypothetical protein
MKRSILSALLIIFACSTAVLAQDSDTADSRKHLFGLRMGLNYSSLFGGQYDSYDPRIALSRGLYLRIPLSENLYLEPGFYYSLEGGETTAEDANGTFDQTLKLNYVDMPLLMVCEIGDGFFVFAGPEASVNVYSKIETEWSGDRESEPVADVNDIMLNASGGFGYEFENMLNLRVMYTRSLTSTFASASGETTGANVFQMALGYTF